MKHYVHCPQPSLTFIHFVPSTRKSANNCRFMTFRNFLTYLEKTSCRERSITGTFAYTSTPTSVYKKFSSDWAWNRRNLSLKPVFSQLLLRMNNFHGCTEVKEPVGGFYCYSLVGETPTVSVTSIHGYRNVVVFP